MDTSYVIHSITIFSILALFLLFMSLNFIRKKIVLNTYCSPKKIETFDQDEMKYEINCADPLYENSPCCKDFIDSESSLVKVACDHNSVSFISNPITGRVYMDQLYSEFENLLGMMTELEIKSSNVNYETEQNHNSLSNLVELIKQQNTDLISLSNYKLGQESNYSSISNQLNEMDKQQEIYHALSNLELDTIRDVTGLINKEAEFKTNVENVIKETIHYIHSLPIVYLHYVNLWNVYKKTEDFTTNDVYKSTNLISSLSGKRSESFEIYEKGRHMLKISECLIINIINELKRYVYVNNLNTLDNYGPKTLTFNNIDNSDNIIDGDGGVKLRVDIEISSNISEKVIEDTISDNITYSLTYEDSQNIMNTNLEFTNVGMDDFINYTFLQKDINLENTTDIGYVNDEFKRQPTTMLSTLEKIYRKVFGKIKTDSKWISLDDVINNNINEDNYSTSDFKNVLRQRTKEVSNALVRVFLDKVFSNDSLDITGSVSCVSSS